MSHLLRLERNGSYITLTTGNYAVVSYNPQTPELTSIDAVDLMDDGGEKPLTTRRNVTETIELILRPTAGQTMANVQTAWQQVESWLRLAEEYQRSFAGYPVYLEFTPDSTTGVYRSEVLAGKLDLQSDAMQRWMIGRAAKGVLVLSRRFYWEAAESELPLSTSAVTRQTGGVTLYNHDDAGAGHDDWCEVTGSDVLGVLPAPVRMLLTNTYNVSDRDSKISIGQNLFGGTLTHVLEGEMSPTDGSDVADAACSSGYRRTLTLTGSSAILRTWALSTAFLDACKGRQYRIFGRFPAITSGVSLKLRIGFPSGVALTTVAETAEIQTTDTDDLQELGVLQLPPWLPQESSFYPVDLELYGYKAGGTTITLDCLFFMPTDNYRILNPQGYGMSYNVQLTDDGIANRLFTENWGAAGKTGHYLGYGTRPMVWPGQTSRLYFLSENTTGTAEIARTRSVRMWYRPRRLTV